jgi:hypothetical protein
MKWLKPSQPIPSVQITCPRCQRTLKVEISYPLNIGKLRNVRDHALKAHQCPATHGGKKQ